MKFKTKGFTSLLLSCSFAVAAFSGVILYMTPRGRVANWTGWTMLGLDKHSWGALHINACLLFLIAAIVHLVLNWRVFLSYIKKRSTSGLNLKLEMAIAVLATVCLVAGTLWHVPPLTAPVTFNEKIKNYWEQDAPQGPAPHAEEFTVERFAGTVGLTTDDVVNSLTRAGYKVEDTGMTIGNLAEENGIVPNQVLAAVRESHPEVAASMAGSGRGMGRGMGGGMGRGMGRGMGGGCSESPSGSGATSDCRETEGNNTGNHNLAEHRSGSCESTDGESCSEGGPGTGRGQGGGMGPGWMRGGGRGMGAGRWRDQKDHGGHGDDQDQGNEKGNDATETPEDHLTAR